MGTSERFEKEVSPAQKLCSNSFLLGLTSILGQFGGRLVELSNEGSWPGLTAVAESGLPEVGRTQPLTLLRASGSPTTGHP